MTRLCEKRLFPIHLFWLAPSWVVRNSTRLILENDTINVTQAANDKDTVKIFQNPLKFSAAEMEIKSSDNDVLNNSPGFCNYIDVGMFTDGAQVMLQDYSNMHTNVTHTSNLQHFRAMINSRGFIDIYEYLHDRYEVPTSKLINDDVDKTPVADMTGEISKSISKKSQIWTFKHLWT